MRSHNFGFCFGERWNMTNGVQLMERPKIPRPELRGKRVVVPGRSGDLWMPEDAYDNIQFDLKCRAVRRANLPEISAWLTGFGDLAFSFEPEYCYRARLTAKYDYQRLHPGRTPHDFTLRCDCQPFRYYANPATLELMKSAKIVNPGTYWSAPSITVYGSGDIVLTINGRSIGLTGITDAITLDSEMQEAFRNGVLLNGKMSGEFPYFPLGKTLISWQGTVSKVVVSPNWRWL